MLATPVTKVVGLVYFAPYTYFLGCGNPTERSGTVFVQRTSCQVLESPHMGYSFCVGGVATLETATDLATYHSYSRTVVP